ncbi:uncharacterized protein MONOS_6556 [Monocercomonoides exilis]|uniref:uncharacterized protein n=1 Tax=Monocercomonoides exilis TaxID=2049356 RepID=UPI00355A6FF5|nr:hypothetical protein MONOS_6556 [Monocercomonoides exilis]|eukprot:MONOS_6556.1-p1 / transcript=MONOS_6556.1 / gene=MONOS_6556 / organism=Monocercomonoides_exilis_PA203 / gene_product=unspecified product / transcript_product=unspecified product / location=Mono_scaffold00208:41464-42818(+) / protein_length=377 / sequence_SO=supercontig / SO=protein_coding / is_pseudo=false
MSLQTFKKSPEIKLITAKVNNVDTPFKLQETPWGWGLKVMKHYKKGDLVCHYQGEILNMKEYRRRFEEKIRTGNLVFSYVQMSKTKILDPDYSDENIGKYANAACRELGEKNNCYYARDLQRNKVNIKAITNLKPNDWVLCAYGTAFSGRLRKLRETLTMNEECVECSSLDSKVNIIESPVELSEEPSEKINPKAALRSIKKQRLETKRRLNQRRICGDEDHLFEENKPQIATNLPLSPSIKHSQPLSSSTSLSTSPTRTQDSLLISTRPGADPLVTKEDHPDLLKSPPVYRRCGLCLPTVTVSSKCKDDNIPLKTSSTKSEPLDLSSSSSFTSSALLTSPSFPLGSQPKCDNDPDLCESDLFQGARLKRTVAVKG